MAAVQNGVRSVIHVDPTAGETVDVLGDTATFKVPSAVSGGSLIIAEIVTRPGGGPPGLHAHPTEEAFYVLEGEYEVSGLDSLGVPFTAYAVPGSIFYVPSDAAHTFKQVSTGPGRLLVIYTSPELEQMARELAIVGAKTGPTESLDPGTVMGILFKHGIRFVEPAHR